jgi:hypothetical protein
VAVSAPAGIQFEHWNGIKTMPRISDLVLGVAADAIPGLMLGSFSDPNASEIPSGFLKVDAYFKPCKRKKTSEFQFDCGEFGVAGSAQFQTNGSRSYPG